MAGFGFVVAVRRVDEEPLVQAVLAGLQRWLRVVGLEFHYRRRPDRFDVTVDGPLPAMQAALIRAGREAYALAEGFPTPPGMQRRERIARRVIQRGLARGVGRTTDDVLELAAMMGGTPRSYHFDPVDHPVVDYRMAELGWLLGRYHVGDATPEQAVEELHTVAELVLGVVLDVGWEDRAFQEQVDEAHRRRLLSAHDREALTGLKNHRKRVRHRRALSSDEEVEAVLPDVLGALHRLVAQVQKVERRKTAPQ